MNKKFVPCVLAILLGVLMPAEKSWAQGDDFSLGGFALDQLAEAQKHLEEYRGICAENARMLFGGFPFGESS